MASSYPSILVILVIVGMILHQAGSRQPYMDGLTTTISMGAQILQTAKFANHGMLGYSLI